MWTVHVVMLLYLSRCVSLLSAAGVHKSTVTQSPGPRSDDCDFPTASPDADPTILTNGPKPSSHSMSGPLMIQMSSKSSKLSKLSPASPPASSASDYSLTEISIETSSMDEMLDAMELLDLVNEYRLQRGLKEIEISPALMAVSSAHVKDLNANPRESGCNLHSWSNTQPTWWSGCCYTPDHAAAGCMWKKGKEITSCWGSQYQGNIYENAYSGSSSPQRAFGAWKGSAAHHAVIINDGMWSRFDPWPAMGAAMSGRYAVLIFGDRHDRMGPFQPQRGSVPHCGPEAYRPFFSLTSSTESTTSTTTTTTTTSTTTTTTTSTTTTSTTSTTASTTFVESLFSPADAGLNRVCRNYQGRNSETFYSVKSGVATISECKDLCVAFPSCTGIEFSAGRCELWTTPIGATKEMPGFSCYHFNLPQLEAVDGGEGRACRGANENDNSPSYYIPYSGPTSINACKALCAHEAKCKGIEFSQGRCEVWTSGIGASKALAGFTCMRKLP